MLRKTNNLFQKAHKTHRRRGMKSEENRRMWSSAVVQIDRVQMWGKFLWDGKFERFSTLSRLNVVAETCRNFTRWRGRNPPHLSRSSNDSGAMWKKIWFMLKNGLCECSTSLFQNMWWSAMLVLLMMMPMSMKYKLLRLKISFYFVSHTCFV